VQQRLVPARAQRGDDVVGDARALVGGDRDPHGREYPIARRG
jgi:hypothetical protein